MTDRADRDIELIDQYLKGDIDAFTELVTAHEDMVFATSHNHKAKKAFTFSFKEPVAVVGSFVGMGGDGLIDTLTIQVFGSHKRLLSELTVSTDTWSDLENREGFWGIRSDEAEIHRITIINDSNDHWGSTLVFDNLSWSATAIPEPATLTLLGCGAAMFVAVRVRKSH